VRQPTEQRDWEAERRARDREWAIETNAARMAAPKFAGTPLEGIVFWPKYQARLVDEDPDDKNFALVSVLVRVSVADIDAHRADAAQLYDEAMAANDAAKAISEPEGAEA
jgi:ParB family chromosome partitioning protein